MKKYALVIWMIVLLSAIPILANGQNNSRDDWTCDDNYFSCGPNADNGCCPDNTSCCGPGADDACCPDGYQHYCKTLGECYASWQDAENACGNDWTVCYKPAKRGGLDNAKKKPLVILSSFKIADNNGKVGLKMSKTGQISDGTKRVGVISGKGNVFNTSGKLIARLRDTGILETASGEPLVKIDTDGTLDNGSGVLIHWLKDGTLARGDENLDFKLSPPNSPARRAASIVLFLYFDFTIEGSKVPLLKR